MFDERRIKKELKLQGFPVTGKDVAYTAGIVATVNEAQATLKEFPDLHKEKPMTVVDKGALGDD